MLRDPVATKMTGDSYRVMFHCHLLVYGGIINEKPLRAAFIDSDGRIAISAADIEHYIDIHSSDEIVPKKDPKKGESKDQVDPKWVTVMAPTLVHMHNI